MLDWLTGSSRPDNALDEGVSSVEEPPETPAPLFAVRAFKTAIFGTPQTVQREFERTVKPSERDKANERREIPGKPEEKNPAEKHNRSSSESAANFKLDPIASPAKGILLTPGTTATRRKTVSFLHLEESDPRKSRETVIEDVESKLDPVLTPCKRNSEAPSKDQPRQSKLTRTLIELSKQKSKRKSSIGDLDIQSPEKEVLMSTAVQTEDNYIGVDVTMDLSEPRSRSGQYWKTEYEQYHKLSNREMKEIIKYGQNVKSYAAKKDAEATSLNEKLKNELAKVARMESKVTKLAAQLNAAQSQGPEGESESTRLVNELAQQTTLAISYKQKVDHYRAAISKQNGKAGDDNHDGFQKGKKKDSRFQVLLSRPESTEGSLRILQLQSQLDDLRGTAEAADDQARQLQTENRDLKRSLARVKQEMMSYETRRQAREERLKKNEARHKAAKEECEQRLAKLTAEHQELLRTVNRLSKIDETALTPAAKVDAGTPQLREIRRPPKAVAEKNALRTDLNAKASKSSLSPQRKRQQKSVVDIWTLSSHPDAADDKAPGLEPTPLPPSSVKHDIYRTLKEIDQNLVPEKQLKSKSSPTLTYCVADSPPRAPASSENLPSTTSFTPNNKPFIDSTKNIASSPAKLQPVQSSTLIYSKSSVATMGRSASLMTARAASRTSTMGSVRGLALPADRAAAAKARLAKRSAEKKRRQGSD